MAIEKDGYEILRKQVVRVVETGKERAQRALEEEVLRTYHEIGRLLNDHVLGNNERADYGDQTMKRLAGDVGIDLTVLYQSLRFFRLEPILDSSPKLSWTHYRTLLRAPSLEAQRYYKSIAEANGWTVRELGAQIKSGRFEGDKPEPSVFEKGEKRRSLPSLRGRLYTYRLAAMQGLAEFWIDVGFGIFLDQDVMGLRDGDLVVSNKNGRDYWFEPTTERRAVYYSYRARVLSVIDGDTLWLAIDCGFGVWTRQKVRLRGIDTPELEIAVGVRARDFVVEALRDLPFVVVTTTKPDKYDRYLADVFYLAGEKDPEVVLAEGAFLNRELYEVGLAKRV